ncbi:Putative rRNA methylase YtqB [Linum grandiflorum]
MAGLKLSYCFSPHRHCFTSLRKILTNPIPFWDSSRLLYSSCNYSHSCRTIPAATPVKKNRTFSSSAAYDSPLSGLDDVLVGFLLGKNKATEVAHLVWRRVVQQGDTVIDATCGNGHDTLAMVKMVADESGRGRVYGLDIQKDALENSSSLLDECLTPKERELVKLFGVCHSRMEGIVPENSPVRLVAFNLGYLPGGDKNIVTVPETTRLALDAAKRILIPGGLISLVVYIGHPGGREELEAVEGFASGLSVNDWSCCKFQMLNRPLAPLLVFLFRK